MSINPVPSFGPQDAAQSADARALRPQSSSSSSTADSQEANAAARAKQEIQQAQQAAAEQEEPQDVVQVQTDSQLENQIVIKYMDHVSGRTILQVPSAEVLSVDLGISKDLQQDLKPAVSPAKPEGGNHGH